MILMRKDITGLKDRKELAAFPYYAGVTTMRTFTCIGVERHIDTRTLAFFRRPEGQTGVTVALSIGSMFL
jgi:hypothetical protein